MVRKASVSLVAGKYSHLQKYKIRQKETLSTHADYMLILKLILQMLANLDEAGLLVGLSFFLTATSESDVSLSLTRVRSLRFCAAAMFLSASFFFSAARGFIRKLFKQKVDKILDISWNVKPKMFDRLLQLG